MKRYNQHTQSHLFFTLCALLCLFPITIISQNINQHQWKNRVLIVKGNSKESDTFKKQILEFKKASQELADRKLILYKVMGNAFQLVDFSNEELKKSGKTSKLFTTNYLNEKKAFEIRLIGLDGTTKLYQNQLLKKEELFKIIDVMPMRRAELNRN